MGALERIATNSCGYGSLEISGMPSGGCCGSWRTNLPRVGKEFFRALGADRKPPGYKVQYIEAFNAMERNGYGRSQWRDDP